MNKTHLIIFPLSLILVLGFFAGKYYAWEKDFPERTSKSFFKDWHIAVILAVIVIIAVMARTKKYNPLPADLIK